LALKRVGVINKEQYNKNCQSCVHLFVHYTYYCNCNEVRAFGWFTS